MISEKIATNFDEEELFNEDTADGFNIADDAVADWAVRKIAEEKAENARLHAIAQDQIDRISEKLAVADKRLESRTAFLTEKLSEFFMLVPHKETKTTAKYQLLSGTLVYTKPKQTYEKDDEKLLAYLKKNAREYVKVEEKPALGEFKKVITVIDGTVINTETGEVVEGVKPTFSEPKFEIK